MGKPGVTLGATDGGTKPRARGHPNLPPPRAFSIYFCPRAAHLVVVTTFPGAAPSSLLTAPGYMFHEDHAGSLHLSECSIQPSWMLSSSKKPHRKSDGSTRTWTCFLILSVTTAEMLTKPLDIFDSVPVCQQMPMLCASWVSLEEEINKHM